jgi:hypothetical protein
MGLPVPVQLVLMADYPDSFSCSYSNIVGTILNHSNKIDVEAHRKSSKQ